MTQPIISVIIPIGFGEQKWRDLMQSFESNIHQFAKWEFILSHCVGDRQNLRFDSNPIIQKRIKLVEGLQGRARQLNRAAAVASGDWLWFLHADTQLSQEHIGVVLALAEQQEGNAQRALYYFPIGFSKPCSTLMTLNQWGANIRSRFFGMPFGDQGFFVHQKTWKLCGPYSEKASYGEDHLFAWSCRHNKVPLKCIEPPLLTSARRYVEQGWVQTSTRHLILTYRQAIPEMLRLICNRLFMGKGA